MKTLTIVTPFLNEEESISNFIFELEKISYNNKDRFKTKLLMIDDGSTDGTVEIINNYSAKIEIKIIKLDKNYGHQFALLAGLNNVVDTDYVITLDSDLQDPPIYINQIFELLQNDSKIVMTKRIKRKDAFIKKINAYIYYRILKLLMNRNDILDSGDYWGIDKDSLKKLIDFQNQKILYFRGQLTQLNLKVSKVEINREPRLNGSSKYGFRKMLSLGLNGIFCKFDICSKLYWRFILKLFIINISILSFINYYLGNLYIGYLVGLFIGGIVVLMIHIYLVSEIDKKNELLKFIDSEYK